MADNVTVSEGSGTKIAADELTYSGDTAKVQIVKLVTVSGSEGSKSATDVPFNANGQATMANSTPVVIASNQTAVPTKGERLEYETVAASQTAQVLGATGATGDYLSHVVIQPTSTSPGVVTVLDNAVEVQAWPGGTVGADLKPITIAIGALSVSGAWKITTGANVKATGYGDFT